MVLHFGELYKLRIVTFRLSPFEQAAMKGIIKHGVPNVLRRIRESVFYVAPSKYIYIPTLHCIDIFYTLVYTYSE